MPTIELKPLVQVHDGNRPGRARLDLATDWKQPMRHIPAVDGLRGAAILLVVACHTTLALEPSSFAAQLAYRAGYAGWIGVDLFFVLSGFLITGILLDSRAGANYYRSFYARRTLRIFPAYYAALVLIFLVAPLTALATLPQYETLQRHAIWYWSYTVNWGQIVLGGQAATPLQTSHFWSLAIEEQFYLVWPLVVARTSNATLRRIAIGLVVVSPAIRMGMRLAGAAPWTVYVATPSHLDGLAVGALIALLARDRGGIASLERYVRPTLAACATVVIGLAIAYRRFAYADLGVQAIGYSALAFGFGALLVGVQTNRRLERLAEQRVLRFFGRYSYMIYIVHFPLILLVTTVLLRVDSLSRLALLAALTVGGSVTIALISWQLLEKPFLALKQYAPKVLRPAAHEVQEQGAAA